MSSVPRPGVGAPLLRRESAIYPTRVLPLLVSKLGEERKRAILDLGPALGVNVDFFRPWARRLTIADFFQTLLARQEERELAAEAPQESPEALSSLFCELLPYDPAETPFDVVLAWDIFNYLSFEQLRALGKRLGAFCCPGSLVFALVSFQRAIPARPRRFTIVEPGSLLYEASTAAMASAPLYEERELARALPDFHVEASYILRHGMKEYLLTFEASANKLTT